MKKSAIEKLLEEMNVFDRSHKFLKLAARYANIHGNLDRPVHYTDMLPSSKTYSPQFNTLVRKSNPVMDYTLRKYSDLVKQNKLNDADELEKHMRTNISNKYTNLDGSINKDGKSALKQMIKSASKNNVFFK